MHGLIMILIPTKLHMGLYITRYIVNTGKLYQLIGIFLQIQSGTHSLIFLSGQSIAGGKLKKLGLRIGPTILELQMRPALVLFQQEDRLNNGTFNYFGYHGFEWSSSELNTNSGLVQDFV